MFTGATLIIIGMIIASTGSTIGQFATGRFVLGCGVSVMTVAAPAYTMEIAPPHWRGRCTGMSDPPKAVPCAFVNGYTVFCLGLYNCGWFGGSIPAAAVTFGTNYINSDYSWRVPVILQAFACTIVLIAVFFIPESPRFLMANGHEDQAHQFLIKYHGGGDPDSRLVALEIAEFRAGIALDGSDKRWWDCECCTLFLLGILY